MELRCLICLSDFEEDFAHIPVLSCPCVLIVHEKCWDQWTGNCLYCRTIPPIRIPRPQPRPYCQRETVMAVISAVILILYARLLFLMTQVRPSSL